MELDVWNKVAFRVRLGYQFADVVLRVAHHRLDDRLHELYEVAGVVFKHLK